MKQRALSLGFAFALVLSSVVAATALGAGVAAADPVDDRYLTEVTVENATANASDGSITYTYDNGTDTATITASGDDLVYRTAVKVGDRAFETTNADVADLRAANLSAAETPMLGPEADTDLVDISYNADGTVTVENVSAAESVTIFAVDSTQVAPGLSAAVDCVDPADDVARFELTNNNSEAASIEYFVEETGASGTVNLSANESTTLTVATTYRGAATLELFADGITVETVDAQSTEAVCDLDERFNFMNTYQYDLVVGEPIEEIGANDTAFYGVQDRLVSASSIMANGDVMATYDVPASGNATKTVNGTTLTYSAVEYDARNDTATATVTLDADASGDTTVSLVGYQLPDDTQEFVRQYADEQVLKDSSTVTLSPGETVTIEIDVPN